MIKIFQNVDEKYILVLQNVDMEHKTGLLPENGDFREVDKVQRRISWKTWINNGINF